MDGKYLIVTSDLHISVEEAALSRVHAVGLTGSTSTAVHTTPPNTAPAEIFRHCRVIPPAAITALGQV
ncbi:hypothetical protein OCS65_19445 [Rhodococcus aetherivorans]|uniref:Uncharacterized protein n=1 Tax=Rhodococcus aetherivorans TaxID=191292 RepID=A0AA46PSU9_9NOCA|nr:hypothetical protein [Rhodococcus aetherivorans]UYF92636.1 hypothetical protein OCS65_19445 [Rhodococcus aetherivorans]